ncbi:lasso RiPP family leader peptide-containing protein [Streptomyces goshikiensis]
MNDDDNVDIDVAYDPPTIVEVGEFESDTRGAHFSWPEGFFWRG